jgi:hypothetical protein
MGAARHEERTGRHAHRAAGVSCRGSGRRRSLTAGPADHTAAAIFFNRRRGVERVVCWLLDGRHQLLSLLEDRRNGLGHFPNGRHQLLSLLEDRRNGLRHFPKGRHQRLNVIEDGGGGVIHLTHDRCQILGDRVDGFRRLRHDRPQRLHRVVDERCGAFRGLGDEARDGAVSLSYSRVTVGRAASGGAAIEWSRGTRRRCRSQRRIGGLEGRLGGLRSRGRARRGEKEDPRRRTENGRPPRDGAAR